MTETQVEHYTAACAIAHSVHAAHAAFITQVNAEKENNAIFAKALAKYGGIQTFFGFQFQCFDKQACGLGKEYLFGDVGLLGYLEANKDKVILEEFNVIEVEVKNRFEEILRQLAEIDTQDTAIERIEQIRKTLIRVPVNEVPALS